MQLPLSSPKVANQTVQWVFRKLMLWPISPDFHISSAGLMLVCLCYDQSAIFVPTKGDGFRKYPVEPAYLLDVLQLHFYLARF